MQIKLYQVDAFANKVFEGNPAAVCPLEYWLDDATLLKIAEENNLSETAFFVKDASKYQLRWFTPLAEVDLCGHATLAAAHVLFKHLGFSEDTIVFSTRSGELGVENSSIGYSIDFPASPPKVSKAPQHLLDGLGIAAEKVLVAYDYIVVLDDEASLASLKPNFAHWLELDLRGVLVTAPSNNFDFVSRCFFPKLRVNEDPVTGSAHCELAPYWGSVLGKNKLIAKQLSSRSGVIDCQLREDRVILTGNAVDYMQGVLNI